MKSVDTIEYVSMLRELTEDGKEVRMTVSGSSMSPFLIHKRDSVCFEKPKKKLKAGDIVFYQRTSGQFVMHRIYKIKSDGYYLVGDAQTEIEGPLERSQIFAVITKVCRKGKWLSPKSFLWLLFSVIWIRIVPCRPFISKTVSKLLKRRTSDG